MESVLLKDVKKGTYFRLKDDKSSPLWVRSDYVREAQKYSTYKYEDVNHERLLKGTFKVFV